MAHRNNGLCRNFASTGNCRFGDRSTSAEAPEAEEQEDGPDLFSVEGLATGNGSTRDERYTLTPSDAHNHLKAFLWDNFRFETAARVQGFVLILASVNDRNKAWNSENAQAFLDAIVRGNALLRIGDVLRFEPVDTAIGHGRGVLSFQNGYFPILEYLSSNLVLKTTMHKNINHLYSTLKNNYDVFRTVLHASIGKMVQAKSWKDPTVGLPPNLQNSLDGVMVFHTVSTVLYQLFSRFKDAVRDHPDIVQLVMDLATWFQSWAEDVSANPPRFMDPLSSSPLNVRKLTISRLDEEITRLKTIVQRESETAERLRRPATRAVLSPAQRREALYSQLAQTYDPPGSLRPGGARHDNDKDSIAGIRIAPTHGELLCPIAAYLPVFLPNAPHHLPASSMERHLDIQFRLLREELMQRQQLPTKLEEILRTNGGAYRTTGYDSVFFQVYTGVEFSPVKAERRNLTVGLNLDTPNHRSAKDKDWKKRVEYWEHSKRLQSGTLVALLIISHGSCRIFLGVVSSFSGDIAESAKASTERIQIRISFFDAEVELMALRKEALATQTIEPTEIPFARYIAHSGSLNTVPLNPPRYAMRPGFTYKLDCLAKPGHGSRIQALDILRPGTNDIARRQLREHSILDPSQIDAVINTFNREVSLIQGPPGTGKSFTAKEILRVLFASKIRPIVLIAFTNHALDHMLTSVLDAKITTKLVRLGSRSSDERIAEYTLDKLEKQLEEQMQTVMESIQLPTLTWAKIEEYLMIHHPEHAERLESPPYWVAALTERLWTEEDVNGEWVTQKAKGKKIDDHLSRTLYGLWRNGTDIDFIKPFPVPVVQQASASVWNMSQDERTLLATEWEKGSANWRIILIWTYNDLRDRYKEACQEYNDMKDENISPRVLMVEEAGQVLEAHVLTSLVSSVHHLICIGDPQQLRPNLATYALSMDSERGKELFKFDRSMMERLADGGLPMSQINVQRRMRPEISHFIRRPELSSRLGHAEDVLFFTHTNKENGSDDSESVSKCNDFEVEMIRDLVLYLLRQGVYNGAGDIAVLCAYLGQLTKVRAALRDLKIAVSVDERDQEQLARQGLEEEAEYEEVLVAKHVRLGTVDIFQGQEAKVVIVSLVRNSGTYETGSASIGFLKVCNFVLEALVLGLKVPHLTCH
ncbi:uncharacterized protein B0H18DRAFT_951386 [Fomitopsis serialis]|uniref:uncharacterized protein n=1 Tax=Fomitopsis serialis TaxID=139415 RepID=UPI0020072409|nr:uncharacterized protein B0H18DRAFT_951386 [Neoantrodia serialis]KAH9934854.1 hypothetical protein B0H18DRAFT_951386 [Neoantrodia serialis]